MVGGINSGIRAGIGWGISRVLRTFKLLPNVVQYINITYYTSVKVSMFLRLNFISGRDTGDKTGVGNFKSIIYCITDGND